MQLTLSEEKYQSHVQLYLKTTEISLFLERVGKIKCKISGFVLSEVTRSNRKDLLLATDLAIDKIIRIILSKKVL